MKTLVLMFLLLTAISCVNYEHDVRVEQKQAETNLVLFLVMCSQAGDCR